MRIFFTLPSLIKLVLGSPAEPKTEDTETEEREGQKNEYLTQHQNSPNTMSSKASDVAVPQKSKEKSKNRRKKHKNNQPDDAQVVNGKKATDAQPVLVQTTPTLSSSNVTLKPVKSKAHSTSSISIHTDRSDTQRVHFRTNKSSKTSLRSIDMTPYDKHNTEQQD